MKTLLAAAAVALSLTATPFANAQGPAAPAFCKPFNPATYGAAADQAIHGASSRFRKR